MLLILCNRYSRFKFSVQFNHLSRTNLVLKFNQIIITLIILQFSPDVLLLLYTTSQYRLLRFMNQPCNVVIAASFTKKFYDYCYCDWYLIFLFEILKLCVNIIIILLKIRFPLKSERSRNHIRKKIVPFSFIYCHLVIWTFHIPIPFICHKLCIRFLLLTTRCVVW